MDILIKNELQKMSSSFEIKNMKKAAEVVKSAVSSNAINNIDANALKSILLEAGIPLNDDTLSLAQNLLKNNIPVNKQTLTKLKQAMQIYDLEASNLEKTKENNETNFKKGEHIKQNQPPIVTVNDLPKIIKKPDPIIKPETLQKAIFTLANDIKIDKQNTNAVTKLAENINFHKQLSNISQILESFKDLPIEEKQIKKEDLQDLKKATVHQKEQTKQTIKEAIYELLTKENSIEKHTEKQLLQKFSLNLNEPRDLINNKLELLHKNLSEALQFTQTLENLTQEQQEELNNLKQALSNTRDTCALLPQIKDVIFIPLPINIEGQTHEAELYIWQNGKNKEKNSSSALLSLNMSSLGKIESYITKEENTINIQFKLSDDKAKLLIKREIETLRNLLGKYHLQSISYLNLEEPFNLIKQVEIKEIHSSYSSIDHRV
ncbi:MAG: hypothetical protein FWF50_02780 [Defluviitaleaceae bacterium]|nr:hypothetical protein [Defluviitaleaceae bacterium]